MYSITLKELTRTYKNNGQHAEQVARFTLTNEIIKADNKPYWMGGDIGNLQIKSFHATICKDCEITDHITIDPATSYGYVIDDFSRMFIMTKQEYLDFVTIFNYLTTCSKKEKGKTKYKIRRNSQDILRYLENKVN